MKRCLGFRWWCIMAAQTPGMPCTRLLGFVRLRAHFLCPSWHTGFCFDDNDQITSTEDNHTRRNAPKIACDRGLQFE
jgi:hypothetical protein